MSKLYDRKSGQWIEVDDADVTPLVASGDYAFAKGLRIPVVFPDGQLGDLPSENAEEAFRDGGYRWASHEDATAWEDGEKARDAANRYGKGQMGNAAIAGGLRGYTFGLSDKIIPTAAEFVKPGSGEGVKEGLSQLKEQNPGTSAIAQGVGMLANPLLRGASAGAAAKGAEAFSKVAGSRLAAAEARLMPEFLTQSGAVNLGTASKLAEGIGRAGIGGAAEGAFFGLSDGVSETALGDPSELAQNLAAGAGTGALFGGAFGASFGTAAAAPYLKSAVGSVASTADEVVQAGLRKGAKATLVPALALSGRTKLAKIAGDLIDQPELMDAYFNGGIERFGKVVKDYRALEAEARSEAKGIEIALKEHVRGAKRSLQNDINQRLTDAGKDVNLALRTVAGEQNVRRAAFIENLKADPTPSTKFDSLYEEAGDLVKALRATGHTKAINRANEIEQWFNAQMAGRASGRLSKVPQITEGVEHWMGNELRDFTRLNRKNFPAEPQAILKKFEDRFSKRLRGNARFGAEQAKLDDTYDVFEAFRSFVTKVKKDPTELSSKRSVLKSMLTDPLKASDFDTLVSNFGELVPEVEAVRLAGKDLVARQNALNALSAKMNTFRDRRLTRGLDVEDFDEIIKAINPDDKMIGQVDRLRELSDTLKAGKDMGPVSKLMALQKKMGKPIDEDLAALVDFEKGFGGLETLRKASEPRGPVDSLAKSLFLRMGIQHIIGGPTGAIFGGIAAGAANPFGALRTLSRLNSLSNKTARAMEKATGKAIDALTKPGVRRATTAAMVPAFNSFGDRRKNFKDRAAYLNSMRDPNKALEEVEKRVGTLDEAPMVSAAMGAQFTKTANFLADKLPIDPLAHTGLNYHKSSWEPSDVELSRFERYATAAENPMSVLEDVANGSVTPEQIETLKALYPATYERLQQGVLDAIMDENADLTYEQRLNIGTLFDIPTDATMSPQFIAAMQSQFASPPPATGQPQQSGPNVQINIDPQAIATEVSRLTYGSK